MKLSDVSIRRPVFATMMILALLVLGAFSYLELPIELWPEVDFPFVVVQTTYPGASAETIETEVTREIEEAVNQIAGIRHIQSLAQEGFTYTFIEFQLETDGAVAAQDVREKVAGIRAELPDDIDEPIIAQFDPQTQPVMSIAVAGRRPQRQITQLVKDRIKPRLETVSGVGAVEIVGGREREILVELNPVKMEAFTVSVDDVRAAVTMANLEIPGGRMDEASREYVVRVKGRLAGVDDFKSIVVKNHDGTQILLSDVASVKDSIVEMRSLSRYNDRPAVSLNVKPQSGANVVDLADGVHAAVEQLRTELPPDMRITIVNDNSIFINEAIHEILFNIQFGTALAVLVIFMFLLDLRPTIITGLSIPISIVATFTAMRFMGFTVNFMTLLGLSLAVGILIDDSIVVVENIYRKIQEGESPFRAAFSGTAEIGLAVAATTFSIMVVFLPVAFMSGLVGRFFYQFGMTVAFAVLISLFVAFTLVPMLTARTSPPKEEAEALDPARARGWRKAWLRVRRPLSVWNRFFDSFKPVYRRLLAGSLRHRFIVLGIATLAMVSAIGVGALLGFEFMPESDQGKVFVNIESPPGTTLEKTSGRIAQVEEIAAKFPEVAGRYVTVGAGNDEVTKGSLLLLLTAASERQITAKQMADSLRTLIAVVPGIKTSISLGESEGGSDKPVEFSVRGQNRDELTRLARQAQRIVREIPGTIDVDNSLEEGKPELQIAVDRKAADDLGLNVASISQTIRTLVEGEVVTQFKDEDEDYDVRLRLAEQFRDSEGAIGRILVGSTKDVPGRETFLVPLRRVVSLSKTTSVGEYRRYDREPEVRVNANVLAGSFAGTIAQQAQQAIDTLIAVPPGYTIQPVGEQEIMVESFRNIFTALILSVVFIYLLLASQYESFFDPLSIMLSLPLSLVGALLGLFLGGSSISIISLIGVVLLMGLVTKNAILLIDFVKQRRAHGLNRNEAILDAGPVRLRPILMTTFATVFGMLPLALGLGPGAEMRAPMARAVIGGMISSTMLTLVVVPVVYSVVDDAVSSLSRRLNRLLGRAESGEAARSESTPVAEHRE